MKHGSKRPNQNNAPVPGNLFYVSKRVVAVPNPGIPGTFINVMMPAKGKPYVDKRNLPYGGRTARRAQLINAEWKLSRMAA